MNELLVQSHVPNLILLLPSIPSELSATGYLTLFCRGDIKASLSWRNGNVTEATLLFNSNHPWHRGIEESPSGSGRFTLSQKLSRFSVFISSPNILYSNVSSCAHISATNIESVWVAGRPILEIVHGVVNSFPC